MPATDLGTIVDDIVRRHAKIEQMKIEADLLALLGPQPWPRRVRRAPLEVVMQNPPSGGMTQYRGIRRKGRLVIDHFPDWPLL